MTTPLACLLYGQRPSHTRHTPLPPAQAFLSANNHFLCFKNRSQFRTRSLSLTNPAKCVSPRLKQSVSVYGTNT